MFGPWKDLKQLVELHETEAKRAGLSQEGNYKIQVALSKAKTRFYNSVLQSLGKTALARLAAEDPEYYKLAAIQLLDLCDKVFTTASNTTSVTEDLDKIQYYPLSAGADTGLLGLMRQVIRAYDEATAFALPRATNLELVVTTANVTSECSNGTPRKPRGKMASRLSAEFQPRVFFLFLQTTLEAVSRDERAVRAVEDFKLLLVQQPSLDITLRAFLLMAKAVDIKRQATNRLMGVEVQAAYTATYTKPQATKRESRGDLRDEIHDKRRLRPMANPKLFRRLPTTPPVSPRTQWQAPAAPPQWQAPAAPPRPPPPPPPPPTPPRFAQGNVHSRLGTNVAPGQLSRANSVPFGSGDGTQRRLRPTPQTLTTGRQRELVVHHTSVEFSSTPIDSLQPGKGLSKRVIKNLKRANGFPSEAAQRADLCNPQYCVFHPAAKEEHAHSVLECHALQATIEQGVAFCAICHVTGSHCQDECDREEYHAPHF